MAVRYTAGMSSEGSAPSAQAVAPAPSPPDASAAATGPLGETRPPASVCWKSARRTPCGGAGHCAGLLSGCTGPPSRTAERTALPRLKPPLDSLREAPVDSESLPGEVGRAGLAGRASCRTAAVDTKPWRTLPALPKGAHLKSSCRSAAKLGRALSVLPRGAHLTSSCRPAALADGRLLLTLPGLPSGTHSLSSCRSAALADGRLWLTYSR
mmetsp:Transcript_7340/g.22739  ORF Transcript_7340/g.22739 Transcript_7340/m.22739 type:complete len:211 (-) Transcript_7340:117-749(-)